MNFIKGVMVGTAISLSAMMLYNESSKGGMNKMMKQGKKWMKNMKFM